MQLKREAKSLTVTGLITKSKRYQGTGILKGDCKQPLRIGIIRALNECTGRPFRATTRYNHKSSDMQGKKISNDQELIRLELHKPLPSKPSTFTSVSHCCTPTPLPLIPSPTPQHLAMVNFTGRTIVPQETLFYSDLLELYCQAFVYSILCMNKN